MLLAALDHYYEQSARLKPSHVQAKRAIALVAAFIEHERARRPTVAWFGPIRQRVFIAWSRDSLGHAAGTIARNLSVVAAAFQFCRRQVVAHDGFGNAREVKLLDDAPDVVMQPGAVALLADLPDPSPRDWQPTYEQFAAFIDAIDKRQENLFRYVVIALNTWARPEAILDLRIAGQVDFAKRIVNLNPPGRRQTKKHRPKITLTDGLAAWFREWDRDAPLQWNGSAITTIDRTFARHAEACGLAPFTPYTIRHFMATEIRNKAREVGPEQRDEWLGHGEKRTADWYEHYASEWLQPVAQGTEAIIAHLQEHAKRPLFARNLRANPLPDPVSPQMEVS